MALAEIRRVLPDATARDVVFYAYAVLCSSVLLEAFAPAYFTASATENIPRIPLVNNAPTATFLIEKGRELAELENPRMSHELQEWASGLEEAFQRSFNLIRFDVDEESKEIRLYDGGRTPRVKLTDIPDKLLRMTVSGYNVVTCWLKFHSNAYTRTEFMPEDYRGLLELLSKLDRQTEVIEAIDVVVDDIINGHIELL